MVKRERLKVTEKEFDKLKKSFFKLLKELKKDNISGFEFWVKLGKKLFPLKQDRLKAFSLCYVFRDEIEKNYFKEIERIAKKKKTNVNFRSLVGNNKKGKNVWDIVGVKREIYKKEERKISVLRKNKALPWVEIIDLSFPKSNKNRLNAFFLMDYGRFISKYVMKKRSLN